MKFKVTSFHLVTVVIIQIILINAVLAAFFIKQSNNKKSGSDGIKSVMVENGQGLLSGRNSIKDPLLEIIEKTKAQRPRLTVYKIPDAQGHKIEFTATAYDLSYQSCGKYPSHPMYGITFSGSKAVRGRTIAVDPDVIPLGSVVYIEFPEEFSYLNGLYTAEDTGEKVKGKMVDIFLGKSALEEAKRFGRMKVHVKIIQQA